MVAAVVVTVSVAVAVPLAVGVMEAGDMEHVASDGAPEQLSATAPTNPFNDVTVTAAVPEAPCATLSEAGAVTVKSGGAEPVPVRLTEIGAAMKDPVTTRFADSAPMTEGLKVMPSVQVDEAAMLNAHVFEAIAKSTFDAAGLPAVIVMALSGWAMLALFVNVSVCAAVVVPSACVPRLRLVGDTVKGATIEPAPVSGTEVGKPAAVTTSRADSLAATEGFRVTLTTQLAPAARVVPQVLAETA
jgi:hypothetical protein